MTDEWRDILRKRHVYVDKGYGMHRAVNSPEHSVFISWLSAGNPQYKIIGPMETLQDAYRAAFAFCDAQINK